MAITDIPGAQDFEVYRGDSFSQPIALVTDSSTTPPTQVPVDLTGCLISAQVRVTTESKPYTAFTVSNLDAVNGKFTLSLSPAQTAALTVGDLAYDVQVTSADGTVETWLAGTFTVDPDVTRP